MRKSILAIALAASALPAAPALAEHDRGWHGHRGEYYGDYNEGYGNSYNQPQQYYRTDNGIRYWQGQDGRNYCRKPNGTTGLLIGGVAGALIGRSIDRHGDRALGTILGAAGGALLGREIERSGARCR